MSFQIGTDEAGYGPNLGPLTITGTLWNTNDRGLDLYAALANSVTSAPIRNDSRLFIADSKRVYGPAKGLGDLETAVLAILYSIHGHVPEDWLELVDSVCDSPAIQAVSQETCLFERTLKLPVAANVNEIRRMGNDFSLTCQAAKIELLKISCVPIFPSQFNDAIELHQNKASLLSYTTLGIVKQLLDLTTHDVEVGCDKHGGRSKYAAILQETVTDQFVVVGRESLQISDYRFRDQERDVSIRFEAKGESFLPTALASMVSKYVREVLMILWNGFWQDHLSDIKPTKGYPRDAKRFKAEISAKQIELGISDHAIWRNR